MQITPNWLIPIILLPGVALLIISTSARFAQIHEEIHHIVQSGETVYTTYRDHLQQRSTLFRNAMVPLYISVATFALGSILGILNDLIVFIFAFFGILSLILAAGMLIFESILSLRVIQHHMEMINVSED